METTHSTDHKHMQPHVRDISVKLQKEVDTLLSSIDEKTIFAEFRHEEMFNIQNGPDTTEIVHTLDDRIFNRRTQPTKVSTITKIERTTTHAARNISRWAKLMQYLFNPLHF